MFYPNKDDSIRKFLNIGPEHTLIGAVGNIRPAKGYDIFLKAAQIIHENHPKARFVVAGEGTGKNYENLIQLRTRLGLENVFFFVA